ncbi:MAG: hypothetical protein Q4G28_12285 [Neisseria sp.]|nr:hypothetical protein [Neisseria sp.]
MSMTSKQQREILELQAQLARLKIAAEYLKQQQERQQQSSIDAGFNKVLGAANSALGLTDGLPSNRLLWNSVFLPLRWRQRLLVGVGLLLWQFWRDSAHDGTRRY